MAARSGSWAASVRWSAQALQPVVDAYAPARRAERVRAWLAEDEASRGFFAPDPGGAITPETVAMLLEKVRMQGMRLPTQEELRAEKEYWDRLWARYLPVFDRSRKEVPTDA